MTDVDPAPYFASFFAVVQSIVAMRDYASTPIVDAIAASARAARADGVLPERMLAYLRHHLRETPLSAVGDWYRSVLVERMVGQAIAAYFDLDDARRREPSDRAASLASHERARGA